jgi:hypothetical protein
MGPEWNRKRWVARFAFALLALLLTIPSQASAQQLYLCTQSGPDSVSCTGNGSNKCTGAGTQGNCPSGFTCQDWEGAFAYCFSPNPCAGRCEQIEWNPGCSGSLADCTGVMCPNTCPGNQVCIDNGSHMNGTCCQPTTCAAHGATCGAIADGCGGFVSCGSCPGGQECNPSNQCCTPTTCAALGAHCGAASDGCGLTLQCGTCPTGQECNPSNQCCTPTTCAAQGAHCGPLPDGCGGTLQCGTCPSGDACNTINQCVACTPTTCSAQGATCGYIINGNCGATLFCGACPANEHCDSTNNCAAGAPAPSVPASTAASTTLLAVCLGMLGLVLRSKRASPRA